MEIQGMPELEAKIKDVDSHIKDKSLITKAAVVCQKQAMINASGRPGPKVQTGRLRSSISYEVKSNEEATVGTSVFYAPLVEFGHGHKQINFMPLGFGMKHEGQTHAYPFLGPVPDQVKDQLEGVFVSFGGELKDVWNA